MDENPCSRLIGRRFREVHGASPPPGFEAFLTGHSGPATCVAVVGYRRASHGPLFLERYLDTDIETAVSAALGLAVTREEIVELGNLAADHGLALVDLWSRAANDLGAASEVAVATLTAPMRAMFARIGLPIVELGRAHPGAVEDAARVWGKYYEKDPRVCAGIIAEGQFALARHFGRRATRRAA